jgi:hypothetical protein
VVKREGGRERGGGGEGRERAREESAKTLMSQPAAIISHNKRETAACDHKPGRSNKSKRFESTAFGIVWMGSSC